MTYTPIYRVRVKISLITYGTHLRAIIEDQTEGWKESWKDDNLKTICGFANTDGGVMKIGIRDDGTVMSVKDPERLLNEIPNTIYNKLSIIPNVTLETKMDGIIVVIGIERLSHPVSYNGRYYKRSGSSTLEVKGPDLDHILRDGIAKPWLDEPMPNLSISDLSEIVISEFKQMGRRSKRLNEEDLKLTTTDLLDKLGLISDGIPTHSATLLFHSEPQRFFPYAR